MRALLLFTVLMVAWLLWSGFFKALLIGLGAFSCLLTVYLYRRMGYFDSDVFGLRFTAKLFPYWAWLAREIWRSSIDVARVVLNPRMPISPRLVEITATTNKQLDLAILGNSITLTPGTLALDVYRGKIQVHCLTKAGADDLLSGEMDRRVAALRQE